MYNPRLHFHFTGIGGSGMSGLAEVLLTHGFKISGTDLKSSEVCERLMKLGAQIKFGHKAEHLPESASLLVYSSAVSQDNPEVVAARERGIPVVRRAEVLAELMRLKYGVAVAGSHGKTTTTSMIASVLEEGKFDPTVIIGGQVKSSGSGAKFGKGEFLVAESDESDRSFLLLKPTIAVVTNIDAEHLNAYTSLAELEQSFEQFVRAVPFYGLAILCIDDRRVRELSERYTGRKVTFGFSPDAQLRAVNLRQEKQVTHFEVERLGEALCSVSLHMPGRHLVSNSLAAVAVGVELGIDPQVIAKALSSFTGVRRRLELIGEANGVVVMNDYGHHPSEIKATLAALREGWKGHMKSLRVLFQPHRFSRTKDCFVEFLDCFRDADALYLTEIYPAGEPPLEGVSGEVLFEALRHEDKHFISSLEKCVATVGAHAEPGDIVLCLGAGPVGALPEQFLSYFEQRNLRSAVA